MYYIKQHNMTPESQKIMAMAAVDGLRPDSNRPYYALPRFLKSPLDRS